MLEETQLHPDTKAQIDALSLDSNHPVVICDADEVLFQFLIHLEGYLGDAGYRLDLRTSSLFGNIYAHGSDAPVETEKVWELLQAFYARDVEALRPIPGASKALADLSRQARVVIVTNLPFAYREGRRRALQVHGMNYPLITNQGKKGIALARLLHKQKAPAFFIEDMEVHLRSAAAIERLHCVQFIADKRLARVAERAEHAYQADNWQRTREYIEERLAQAGRTSVTSGT